MQMIQIFSLHDPATKEKEFDEELGNIWKIC
jgi:hypothetical protein